MQEYPKVSLDEFTVELSFEFTGVPIDMLAHYVREAAIDFAARSRVLLREILVKVQACIPNYLVEPDDCMDISAIVGVKNLQCGRAALYRRFNSYNCCTTCSPHRQIEWKIPDTIWIAPVPTQAEDMILKCYVKPKRDACELDTVLLSEYKDAILHGARYRLYSISNRAWTSREAARMSQVEFERSIASARADKLLAGRKGPIQVKTIYSRC